MNTNVSNVCKKSTSWGNQYCFGRLRLRVGENNLWPNKSAARGSSCKSTNFHFHFSFTCLLLRRTYKEEWTYLANIYCFVPGPSNRRPVASAGHPSLGHVRFQYTYFPGYDQCCGMYLDPDPEFWPSLDPDPRVNVTNFLGEKIEIVLERKKIICAKFFCTTKIMVPDEIFSLQSCTFCF